VRLDRGHVGNTACVDVDIIEGSPAARIISCSKETQVRRDGNYIAPSGDAIYDHTVCIAICDHKAQESRRHIPHQKSQNRYVHILYMCIDRYVCRFCNSKISHPAQHPRPAEQASVPMKHKQLSGLAVSAAHSWGRVRLMEIESPNLRVRYIYTCSSQLLRFTEQADHGRKPHIFTCPATSQHSRSPSRDLLLSTLWPPELGTRPTGGSGRLSALPRQKGRKGKKQSPAPRSGSSMALLGHNGWISAYLLDGLPVLGETSAKETELYFTHAKGVAQVGCFGSKWGYIVRAQENEKRHTIDG